MNVTVLGCGRWGSFLATYHSKNHNVMLWGLEDSESFQILKNNRANAYLTLPESIILEPDLEKALNYAEYIIISISAQNLREFATRLNQYDVSGKTFILCMKGIEADTGKRLTQVMQEAVLQDINLAVWVGPGHVEDFMKGIPNCQVVDSEDKEITSDIVEKFSSDLIRLYTGTDIIGSEIGAAAKNVIGIAAGMLDGKGSASLKGALMARGAREIARLIYAMGGNELSAYGLCHLGDYEATLFSVHSHNRMFGEAWVKGENYTQLAEGVETVKALCALGRQYQVELPISVAVYGILHEGENADVALKQLFSRSTKGEFDY
jgi:Glycerol-3-phosphate dehydrogenase